MGRAKKTKKFATMKRMISASDPRLKDKDRAPPKKAKKEVGTIHIARCLNDEQLLYPAL
jgi:hypothetical protein